MSARDQNRAAGFYRATLEPAACGWGPEGPIQNARTNHVAVVLGPPAEGDGSHRTVLSEIPRGIRKRTFARRYEASWSSSISVIMLPLAERCGKVMRDALAVSLPREVQRFDELCKRSVPQRE